MLLSDICLSEICLSHTSGLTREQERPRKTKTSTEVAHVTRLGYKGQGHQTALLISAALMHKAAAAVSVGT